MAEIYKGTKFTTKFAKKEFINHQDLKSLMKWCEIFHNNQFAPLYQGGSSGNLSFRKNEGFDNFYITAGYTNLGSININTDFVEVLTCDSYSLQVFVNGLKEPSSETFMHDFIYKTRPDIHAIFHGHSELIMKSAKENNFPQTSIELPYGTIESAKNVSELLKTHNFAIIKNHGFVSIGKTQEEAGKFVLNLISAL